MVFELLLLPINVSCDILGVWLTLKSVVFLDSAFCNRVKRCQLLRLFGSKEFVLDDLATLTNLSLLGWLSKKFIRVSNVKFDAETVALHTLVAYVSVVHDGIRCVHFFRVRNTTVVMFLLASYCRKIKTIRCTDVTMSAAFHALLLHNPNIKEIHGQNVSCPEEIPAIHLSLQDFSGMFAKFPLATNDRQKQPAALGIR